jgi:hypothetical protein
MASTAKKTLSSTKTKAKTKTNVETKAGFSIAKVDKFVDQFKAAMGKFNESLKPARQSYINVSIVIQNAYDSLDSRKPKNGEKSEMTAFMEATRIDKYFVNRMLRIAKHASTLNQYADKLPNTDSGLYFVAGLLSDNRSKAMKLLKSQKVVPHTSTKALKQLVGETGTSSRAVSTKKTSTMMDFVVENNEDITTVLSVLRDTQTNNVPVAVKLTLDLSAKTSAERSLIAKNADIFVQSVNAEKVKAKAEAKAAEAAKAKVTAKMPKLLTKADAAKAFSLGLSGGKSRKATATKTRRRTDTKSRRKAASIAI